MMSSGVSVSGLTFPVSASFSGRHPHSVAKWPRAAPSLHPQLGSASLRRAPLPASSFHEPILEGCCQRLPNLRGLKVRDPQGKIRVLFLGEGEVEFAWAKQ